MFTGILTILLPYAVVYGLYGVLNNLYVFEIVVE